MNPDTGHLITPENEKQMEELLEQGYKELPKRLTREARGEMKTKPDVTVDLSADTKLANWARKQRAKKKRHATKASRKKNR